ncbi:MAG: hypothetical protein ACKVJG_23245 [Candidatus Latescibacterota bacterium]|jgi:3-deoxy-7-phosphoheptulonate synthase
MASGALLYQECVEEAMPLLEAVGERSNVFVGGSHANSGKKYQGQVRVWRSVLGQRIGGNGAIVSMMLESCLEEGNQSVAIGRKGCAMAYP